MFHFLLKDNLGQDGSTREREELALIQVGIREEGLSDKLITAPGPGPGPFQGKPSVGGP